MEILTKTPGPGAGHPWWFSNKAVQRSAQELTGDPAWCERALSWIDAYRDAHGHGPTWRTFWRAPQLWPANATVSMLNNVMRQLHQAGLLDGTRTPYGLRRRTPDGS